ncbi:MAG: metal-dependent hydrolase [Magnetospirillum sp.]|nr:metal-dependent hydrolase [Magnetospirillum sp.]
MMAGSHVIVGAALWAVTAKLSGGTPADIPALAGAAMGALLPDMDHPQSWAGRKFRPISVPLSLVVGHRGVTHSLLAVVAGIVALAAMGLDGAVAPVVLGYLSHLAADSLTPSGVPLLWPMKHRFSLNLCRTGSVTEMGVVALIALAGGWATGVDFSHLPRPKF